MIYTFNEYYFVVVKCAKLIQPDNSEISPSSCIQHAIEYGSRCKIMCNPGYHSTYFNNTRLCQHDKTWDHAGEKFNCSSYY